MNTIITMFCEKNINLGKRKQTYYYIWATNDYTFLNLMTDLYIFKLND